MANSIKKTTLNNVYKYAKYLEDLSCRRVEFTGSSNKSASSKSQYDASIKEMKKIFKILNHVKRNLRDRAKDNYMHSLDPYLRKARYNPKVLAILAKTAKKVISKEKHSDHEQKLDRQADNDKSSSKAQNNQSASEQESLLHNDNK